MAQRQAQRQQQRQQQQQSQSQPQPQSQQQNGGKKYFNLLGDGYGYLNRIRTVTPKNKKSETFLACSITALRGSTDGAQYSKFDLNVVGPQAKEVVTLLEPDVTADKRVIVSFRVADYYPTHFTYHKENKEGKKEAHIGDVMKGKLLRIKRAKVNGVIVELPGTDKAPESPDDDEIPF